MFDLKLKVGHSEPIFYGPVILPYILTILNISITAWDNDSV